MLSLFLVWVAVGIGLTLIQSSKQIGSAGLPLAYFLGLSLINVPGAMTYVVGAMAGSEETNWMAVMTEIGFEQTIIGMVSYLGGVLPFKLGLVIGPKLPAQ